MSFVACCFGKSNAVKEAAVTPARQDVSHGSAPALRTEGNGPFSAPAANGATVVCAGVDVTDEGGVATLEEAKRLIAVLTERVRTLEGSTAAADCLLQTTNTLLPLKSGEVPNIRGNSFKNDSRDGDKAGAADGADGQQSQRHAFRAYDKVALVELLRGCGKPAAAVLLQAVCEEDLEAVPPGLLFDVDPAAGEALAAAPQLAAALASTLHTNTGAHTANGAQTTARFGLQQQHQQQQHGRAGSGLGGAGALLDSGLATATTTGGSTASLEALPAYLRLRLYMMQACAARPMLAHANTAARQLFEVRSDRQLQLVLEAHVQQDAMLAMLLQELLDELLEADPAPAAAAAAAAAAAGASTAPGQQLSVVGGEGSRRSVAAGNSGRGGGGLAAQPALTLHTVSHFVNTSNQKVFPFVPVTMRACGYQKTSGEVVPCVILEFSPDSNQGAFLQHLQRDYTMMGRMSAVITLFSLKGDVLHQNAGSIAYFGYRRDDAKRRRERNAAAATAADGAGGPSGYPFSSRGTQRGTRGRGGGATLSLGQALTEVLGESVAGLEGLAVSGGGAGGGGAPTVPASALSVAMQSAAGGGGGGGPPADDETPVLQQLFRYAPGDMLEAMLEAMVQGGVWKAIIPVPRSLVPAARAGGAAAADGGGAGAGAGATGDGMSGGARHGGGGLGADCLFTQDCNLLNTQAVMAFGAGTGGYSTAGGGGAGSFSMRGGGQRGGGGAGAGAGPPPTSSFYRGSRGEAFEGSFGISLARSPSGSRSKLGPGGGGGGGGGSAQLSATHLQLAHAGLASAGGPNAMDGSFGPAVPACLSRLGTQLQAVPEQSREVERASASQFGLRSGTHGGGGSAAPSAGVPLAAAAAAVATAGSGASSRSGAAAVAGGPRSGTAVRAKARKVAPVRLNVLEAGDVEEDEDAEELVVMEAEGEGEQESEDDEVAQVAAALLSSGRAGSGVRAALPISSSGGAPAVGPARVRNFLAPAGGTSGGMKRNFNSQQDLASVLGGGSPVGTGTHAHGHANSLSHANARPNSAAPHKQSSYSGLMQLAASAFRGRGGGAGAAGTGSGGAAAASDNTQSSSMPRRAATYAVLPSGRSMADMAAGARVSATAVAAFGGNPGGAAAADVSIGSLGSAGGGAVAAARMSRIRRRSALPLHSAGAVGDASALAQTTWGLFGALPDGAMALAAAGGASRTNSRSVAHPYTAHVNPYSSPPHAPGHAAPGSAGSAASMDASAAGATTGTASAGAAAGAATAPAVPGSSPLGSAVGLGRTPSMLSRGAQRTLAAPGSALQQQTSGASSAGAIGGAVPGAAPSPGTGASSVCAGTEPVGSQTSCQGLSMSHSQSRSYSQHLTTTGNYMQHNWQFAMQSNASAAFSASQQRSASSYQMMQLGQAGGAGGAASGSGAAAAAAPPAAAGGSSAQLQASMREMTAAPPGPSAMAMLQGMLGPQAPPARGLASTGSVPSAAPSAGQHAGVQSNPQLGEVSGWMISHAPPGSEDRLGRMVSGGGTGGGGSGGGGAYGSDGGGAAAAAAASGYSLGGGSDGKRGVMTTGQLPSVIGIEADSAGGFASGIAAGGSSAAAAAASASAAAGGSGVGTGGGAHSSLSFGLAQLQRQGSAVGAGGGPTAAAAHAAIISAATGSCGLVTGFDSSAPTSSAAAASLGHVAGGASAAAAAAAPPPPPQLPAAMAPSPTARVRRPPSRQTDRSGPNLALLFGGMAMSAAQAGGGGGGGGGGAGGLGVAKSATSFSFGSRGAAQRPLVRMMSFLNASPIQQPQQPHALRHMTSGGLGGASGAGGPRGGSGTGSPAAAGSPGGGGGTRGNSGDHLHGLTPQQQQQQLVVRQGSRVMPTGVDSAIGYGRQLSNPALRLPTSPNPSSLHPSRQNSQRPLSPCGPLPDGASPFGSAQAPSTDIRISDVNLNMNMNLVASAGVGHSSVGTSGGGSDSQSVFRTTGNNIGSHGAGSALASNAMEVVPARMAAAGSGYGTGGDGGDGGYGTDGAGGGGTESAMDPEDEQQYHEITATSFLDPVSKAQVVMIVQTDVTGRVKLERRLAEVMEAEHKLLENIFPRHVLEHIASASAAAQQQQQQLAALAAGRGAAGSLPASAFNLSMLSAMPDPTATATDHEQVTILFSDIVGFTSMCKEVPAKTVMKFLNQLYSRFDTLLDIYGVYKVETIGDCYMVAGGLISKDADGFAAVRKGSNDKLQAWRVLSFAKAMLRDAQKVLLPTTGEPVKMRVGIHTGPVVSGIVGMRMPRFCLFGDTINTASRMESTCPYGRIQVSAATWCLVPDEDWEPTGGVEVKGKGMMDTFLLHALPAPAVPAALATANMSLPGPIEGLGGHGAGGGGPGGGRNDEATALKRMATNAAARAAGMAAAAAAAAAATGSVGASTLASGSHSLPGPLAAPGVRSGSRSGGLGLGTVEAPAVLQRHGSSVGQHSGAGHAVISARSNAVPTTGGCEGRASRAGSTAGGGDSGRVNSSASWAVAAIAAAAASGGVTSGGIQTGSGHLSLRRLGAPALGSTGAASGAPTGSVDGTSPASGGAAGAAPGRFVSAVLGIVGDAGTGRNSSAGTGGATVAGATAAAATPGEDSGVRQALQSGAGAGAGAAPAANALASVNGANAGEAAPGQGSSKGRRGSSGVSTAFLFKTAF